MQFIGYIYTQSWSAKLLPTYRPCCQCVHVSSMILSLQSLMMIVISMLEDVRQSEGHSATIRVCDIVCRSLYLQVGSLPTLIQCHCPAVCAAAVHWISGKLSMTEESAVTSWMFVCHPVGMFPYIKHTYCTLDCIILCHFLLWVQTSLFVKTQAPIL